MGGSYGFQPMIEARRYMMTIPVPLEGISNQPVSRSLPEVGLDQLPKSPYALSRIPQAVHSRTFLQERANGLYDAPLYPLASSVSREPLFNERRGAAAQVVPYTYEPFYGPYNPVPSVSHSNVRSKRDGGLATQLRPYPVGIPSEVHPMLSRRAFHADGSRVTLPPHRILPIS